MQCVVLYFRGKVILFSNNLLMEIDIDVIKYSI